MYLPDILERIPSVASKLHSLPFELPYGATQLSDRLNSASPLRVRAVFFQSSKRTRFTQPNPKLITVAVYRSPFGVIERMAKVIAASVLELSFVPIVVPVSERELSLMTTDTLWMRRLLERSVTLFRL